MNWTMTFPEPITYELDGSIFDETIVIMKPWNGWFWHITHERSTEHEVSEWSEFMKLTGKETTMEKAMESCERAYVRAVAAWKELTL